MTNGAGPLLIALLLSAVALAGKFSVNAARILLFIAWIVGVWSLRMHGVWAAVFTFAVILIGAWARPEVVPRYFGRLTPSRRLLFSTRGVERPRLEIGDSGAVFIWAGPKGQPLFKFFDDVHLTVELIRGRVMVSTKITDERGNIIAEIIRNEWRAPPPHAWDRNYSSDAIEVKNARGAIVLQVKALHDRIQLQGEWWRDPINGVRLVANPPGDVAGGSMIQFGRNNRPPRPPEIRPLFVYPSETNLGRMVEQ